MFWDFFFPVIIISFTNYFYLDYRLMFIFYLKLIYSVFIFIILNLVLFYISITFLSVIQRQEQTDL